MTLTPVGPSVRLRISRIRSTTCSGGSPAAPVMPSPPAFVTAAARRAVAIEPVPAPTIGSRIPRSEQSRVVGGTED